MPQRRSRSALLAVATIALAFAAAPMPGVLGEHVTARANRLPSEAWGEVTASEPLPECGKPTTQLERQAVQLAAVQFEYAEVPIDLADLRVCPVADGYIVVPRTVELAVASSSASDAFSGHAARAIVSLLAGASIAPLEDPESFASLDQTAVGPYWREREANCFAWVRNGSAYLAPCYYIHQLMNDGDGARDYYTLKFRATSGGGRRWDAWLESVRAAGSAAQYWYDWAPGGDVTSNCQNVSLSSPVLGLMATLTSTRCERWDMTLWADAGHFRNKWNCDCWLGIDADREVAFQIGVKMNQGTTPRWTLSAGFTGL